MSPQKTGEIIFFMVSQVWFFVCCSDLIFPGNAPLLDEISGGGPGKDETPSIDGPSGNKGLCREE